MPAGHVLSVNVGLPRDVAWRGRTVRTAIGKRPVPGPVTARTLGLDGDGQADLVGHGGAHRALLVYQRSALTHWARELGRDDLRPGLFGENLTVEGLDDDTVAVGDRFRIGGADGPLVEVSQPRVLCFKTGMALGAPRIPARMVADGLPGFYLRVLEDGPVRAGDAIELVGSDPARLTVREASALLYLPAHDPARLRTALGVPALPEGWRGSFEALLAHGDAPGNPGIAPDAGPAPAWLGTRPLRVAARRVEPPDVVTVELADPGGSPLPHPVAGQHLSLHLPVTGRERPLVRPYSVAGLPGGRYRIAVKREGAASTFLHDRVHAGQLLEATAPRGAFALAPGDGPLLLVSAGIGVTPILAMLEQLADTHPDRPVTWVQSSRGRPPLAAETAAALSRLTAARVLVTRTGPAPRGTGTSGRITAARLAALAVPRDAEVHLCGPPGFATTVHRALDELGLTRVREEVFGPERRAGLPAPHPPAGDAGHGPAVTFARSGIEVAWDPRHGTLLDLAEACDVPVGWSCRTGVCHRCESGLLAGTVDYDLPPLDRPAEGGVLLCCATPGGAVTLDL